MPLEAGDPANWPIILLHGMELQAETWRELGSLDFLADSGFHVLAIDLPGFGKSPPGPASPTEVLGFLCKLDGSGCRVSEENGVDTCDLCNRKVISVQLIWSELSDRRLCAECLAEEESCGCSDQG